MTDKPEPTFTLLDLLQEMSPSSDEEGEFFTTAELAERFSVSQHTIIGHFRQLQKNGWIIKVIRKPVVNIAGIRTTVPAYKLIPE